MSLGPFGVSMRIEKSAVPVEGSAEKASPRDDVTPPTSGRDGTCASKPMSRLMIQMARWAQTTGDLSRIIGSAYWRVHEPPTKVTLLARSLADKKPLTHVWRVCQTCHTELSSPTTKTSS